MRSTSFIVPALRFALRMGQKKRPPRYIILNTIAVILLMVAFIFALIALHDYLRLYFSELATNAFFAGGFAVTASTIFLGIRIAQRRYQAPTLAEEIREEANAASTRFSRVQRDIYRTVLRNEKSWLLAAGVLGIILGAHTRGKRRNTKSSES